MGLAEAVAAPKDSPYVWNFLSLSSFVHALGYFDREIDTNFVNCSVGVRQQEFILDTPVNALLLGAFTHDLLYYVMAYLWFYLVLAQRVSVWPIH